MALASAPSTPEQRVNTTPLIRRSFTAPIKSAKAFPPVQNAETAAAETLFAHNACKIVSFSTSTDFSRRHSSVSDGKSELRDEPAGTLPWASTTERTIAAGPLRIYRVLGTAFLNSGTTLHPVLAKSQCWCVDGVSKFVLRIRPKSYYRIELPHLNQQDEQRVEEFTKILARILQYELTPCPFKRCFTVDLPEPATTPIQKKPWRPKNIQPVAIPSDLRKVDENGETGDAGSRIQEHRCQWGCIIDKAGIFQNSAIDSRVALSDTSSTASIDNGDSSESTQDTDAGEPETYRSELEPFEPKTPTRPKSLRYGRTVTAPPELKIRTPLSTTIESRVLSDHGRESSSISSSVDSFHSFHSPITPLPPSPSSWKSSTITDHIFDPNVTPRVRPHERDVSETTATVETSKLWDMSDAESRGENEYHSPLDLPQTPTLVSDVASLDEEPWSEAKTPSPPIAVRLRSKRRARSPLPSSTNIYSPYSPRAYMSGHHLTTAILQKTCSLLLGPPVQLVALMLRIAAKIARGAFQGSSFGFGEGGQRIPCSWDFSSDESDDVWEEDDYGVSLGRTISDREIKVRERGESWEID